MNFRRGSETFAPTLGHESGGISASEGAMVAYTAFNGPESAHSPSEVFTKLFSEYQSLLETIDAKNITHQNIESLRVRIAEFFAKTPDTTVDEEVFSTIHPLFSELRSIVENAVTSESVTYETYQEYKKNILLRLSEIQSRSQQSSFPLQSNARYHNVVAKIKYLPDMDSYKDSNSATSKIILASRFDKLKEIGPMLDSLESEMGNSTSTPGGNEVAISTETIQPEPAILPANPEYEPLVLTAADRLVSVPEVEPQSTLIEDPETVHEKVELPLENPEGIKIGDEVVIAHTDGSETIATVSSIRYSQYFREWRFIVVWTNQDEKVITKYVPIARTRKYVPREELVERPADTFTAGETVELPVDGPALEREQAETLQITNDVAKKENTGSEEAIGSESLGAPDRRVTLAEMVTNPYSDDELLTRHLYEENVRPYIPAALMELGMEPAEAERWVVRTLDPVIDKIDTEGTAPVLVAAAINRALNNIYKELNAEASVPVPEAVDIGIETTTQSEKETLLNRIDTQIKNLINNYSNLSEDDIKSLNRIREAVIQFHDADVDVLHQQLLRYSQKFDGLVAQLEEKSQPVKDSLDSGVVADGTKPEAASENADYIFLPVNIASLKVDDVVFIKMNDGTIQEAEVEIISIDTDRIAASWLKDKTRKYINVPVEQVLRKIEGAAPPPPVAPGYVLEQEQDSSPDIEMVMKQFNANPFISATERQNIFSLYENYERMKQEGKSEEQLQGMLDNITGALEQPVDVSYLPERASFVLERLSGMKSRYKEQYDTAYAMYKNFDDIVNNRGISENPSEEIIRQAYQNFEQVALSMIADTEVDYQEAQVEKAAMKEGYRNAEATYQAVLKDFYTKNNGKSAQFEDYVLEAYAAYTTARKNYFTHIKESVAARRATLSPEQRDFLTPDRIIATEARLNATAANQLVIEAARARLEIQKTALAQQSPESSRLVETAKRVSSWFKRNKTAIRTVSLTVTVSVAMVAATPLGVAAVAGAGALAGAGWGARLYAGAKGALFGAASLGIAAKAMTDAGIRRQEDVVDAKEESIKITFTENSLQDFDTALVTQLEKLQSKERRQGKIITAATITGGVAGAVLVGGGIGAAAEGVSESVILPLDISPAASVIDVPENLLATQPETIATPTAVADLSLVANMTDVPKGPLAAQPEVLVAPTSAANPDEYYGIALNDPKIISGDVGKIFSDHATPPAEGPVPGVVLPEAEPAEVITPTVGEGSKYSVEQGDNYWDLMEGQTAAGVLPAMRMVSPEHVPTVIRLVQQAIDTDPALRSEIGFGSNTGELRLGATLNVQRLDEFVTKIAIDNNFITETATAPETSPIAEVESAIETEVRVRPGDAMFSIVDSTIAGKLSGVPEYEQQEIRAEVRKMLLALSPEQVRDIGIASGNINQILPGEKIDLSSVVNFVQTEIDSRWSEPNSALEEISGGDGVDTLVGDSRVDSPVMTVVDTSPSAEKMATIVTDEVLEQTIASYDGGKEAFEKDFARYISSIQGADPKGGWFSAILAPDANKANAFNELEDVSLKEIEQVMNMPAAEQLRVLRSHNIRLGDFNAWQDTYEQVKSSGLVKPWQASGTFGAYMTKGFIAQKINSVVT